MIVRLVRVLARFIPLSQLRPARALFHRPKEFATIVLESDGSQPFSLLPVAHKLEASIRLRILREQPSALPLQANWLRSCLRLSGRRFIRKSADRAAIQKD